MFITDMNFCSVYIYRVVYCVMGCCNLEDAHSEVAEKIDDYLWLRLTQIQSSSKMPHGDETLTLPKLQTQLLIDWGRSQMLQTKLLIQFKS